MNETDTFSKTDSSVHRKNGFPSIGVMIEIDFSCKKSSKNKIIIMYPIQPKKKKYSCPPNMVVTT